MTPIFSSFQKLPAPPQAAEITGSLNCRAFSLYNSGVLSTTVTLRMPYYFDRLFFMCTFFSYIIGLYKVIQGVVM